MTPHDPKPHDLSAVPEWAHETIVQIAREHPEELAYGATRQSHLSAIKA